MKDLENVLPGLALLESTGKHWEALSVNVLVCASLGKKNKPAQGHGCPNQGSEQELSNPVMAPKAYALEANKRLNPERKNKITSE